MSDDNSHIWRERVREEKYKTEGSTGRGEGGKKGRLAGKNERAIERQQDEARWPSALSPFTGPCEKLQEEERESLDLPSVTEIRPQKGGGHTHTNSTN